jgi:minor extracellular serine protease Vpr
MNRISVTALSAIVLLLSACGGGGNEAASSVESLSAPGRATVAGVRTLAPSGAKVDVRLRAAKGPVDVWVSMDQEPVAGQQAKLAESAGVERARALSARGDSTASARALADHRRSVVAQQRGIAASVFQMGGTELGRVQMAHNAIAMRVDASELSRIAALPGVVRVRPVLHYQLDLSETVPYVGGTAVQNSGRDGSGVTVAVLDSGIDYAHRNLGGEGTAEAYAAAYGAGPSDPKNTTLDGLFPTAKVVAGFDFVGETWGIVNNAEVGVLTEDPDPIDLEGHGTHVADIIAGQSLDGAHKGVAPGAKLVAVKVCSAISSACNGVALLKGMDYALDPNGDGDMSDAVDVINLSLGSPYGQVEDDLTLAAINAVKLGVIVVASAGNSANRPYVTGSPSIGPGVISVAQTAVPSASAIPLQINAPAAIAGIYGNTQVLEFAPVGAGVTGDVAFIGRGCPAGSVAGTPDEDPYLTSPAGKVVLIDRGSCGVSLKVDRAAKAGATGVLIGLVAAGDAVGFSSAGGDTFVPSLVITRAVSSAIKAQLTAGQTVNVSISPAAAIPLVGSMASSSSRGPSMSAQTIKPEIGAPGASLSAEAGTGNGQTAFGGTSGAAPMVAGAAALMVQAHPKRSALQIKAMLMNSAETAVFTNPALVPGELAPITRIGAGELRVDRAVKLTAAAWNRRDQSATLSFGAVEAAQPLTVERELRVDNFSGSDQVFTVTPSFRYASDGTSGAVQVLAPSSVRVPARGHEHVKVTLVIDPTKLTTWTLNGGSQGGNGAALNGPEYDGYLTFTAGTEKLSVPWHVLPRKAANTEASRVVRLRSGEGVQVTNTGTEAGDYDVFSLTGTSPRLPRASLPKPGDNFAIIDLQSVGVRYLPAALTGGAGDLLEFAITTFGRRAHPAYPAGFEIGIDTNSDGVEDFVVFSAESGGFNVSGQTLVSVRPAADTTGTGVFFADADLNSGNMIFTVPMNSSAGPVNLGVAAGSTMGFAVRAFDSYFTGDLTDEIKDMRFTPGQARYEGVGEPFGSVSPGAQVGVPIRASTVAETATTESGLLFMFRRNAEKESQTVRVR